MYHHHYSTGTHSYAQQYDHRQAETNSSTDEVYPNCEERSMSILISLNGPARPGLYRGYSVTHLLYNL